MIVYSPVYLQEKKESNYTLFDWEDWLPIYMY